MRNFAIAVATIAAAVAATVPGGTTPHSAQATLSCRGTAQPGQQLMSEVMIDVGPVPLGAYSITVTYDPAVLRIASVAGGRSPEFSGAPTTNAASFASGITGVSAFQASSLTGPTGIARVVRITFNVVGTASPRTSVGLTLHDLFDTRSDPISATATGCTVPVTSTKDAGGG